MWRCCRSGSSASGARGRSWVRSWGGTGSFPGPQVVGQGGNVLPAELRHRASPWQRNVGYPLAMLGLLALTVRVSIPLCATAPYGCPKSPLLFSGRLSAHRLLPRPGAAAGRHRDATGDAGAQGGGRMKGMGVQRGGAPSVGQSPFHVPPAAGRGPGPGLLLHPRFLRSCAAGCPHLVSFVPALGASILCLLPLPPAVPSLFSP